MRESSSVRTEERILEEQKRQRTECNHVELAREREGKGRNQREKIFRQQGSRLVHLAETPSVPRQPALLLRLDLLKPAPDRLLRSNRSQTTEIGKDRSVG